MTSAALALRTQAIEVDEVFPHMPEVIWSTLTNDELMARWMMAPAGFAPVVGTHFTFKTTPAGAWDGLIRCEVLEVVPNQRLVYAWRGGDEANIGYGSKLDTRVTWTLTGTEGGTHVRVVHSGFITPKNDTAFKNMGEGWPKVLPMLGAAIKDAN